MSNLYIYDGVFFATLTLLVVIFLIRKRKNLKRENLMYLYRTKIGIKLIDYIGTKYKKTLTVLGAIGVVSGYLLMGLMVYFLGTLIKVYLFQPKVVQAIKIPPIMPLVPYVPELFKIDFLPPFYATYWIVAIAVIAIFHEFAHGIIAKRHGIPIKTTGFGFLGPFLAAFVEPDEKIMEKKSKYQQISVLAAGTFANILLTIGFFLIFLLFFSLAYTASGALFDSYATNVVDLNNISMVGGVSIGANLTSQQIISIIDKNNIKDQINVGDNSKNFTEIKSGKINYLIPIKDLKSQLENNLSYVIIYDDLPAIRNMMDGAIIQIDDTIINDRKDLSKIMDNYEPGDSMKIVTKLDGKTNEYQIILGEDPNEAGRPMIGVGYVETKRGGILSRIFDMINLFREPGTYYAPKIIPDLTLFIYNLLWWLILINFSVALMNMLPFTIFDGGRMFMLTIWGITGSEKTGKIVFKVVTYLIWISFLILIFGWIRAMF
jgi:membrane-associated protease RseP (regulator of RpoE activity)